jgi:ankyrin repeat protein
MTPSSFFSLTANGMLDSVQRLFFKRLELNRLLMGAVVLCLGSPMSIMAGSYEDFLSAIKTNNTRVVQSLLTRGVDPNTPDEKGNPALFLAIQSRSWNVVKVLVEARGIQLDERNPHDETPLMLSVIQGEVDVARLLIDKGADVNKTGWTPLHYAASKGHLELIHILLDEDAYIDAESPNGTTPLMMAAGYADNPIACKVLLEEGADPSLKNDKNLNALDFAMHAKHAEAGQLIETYLNAWIQKQSQAPK